MCFPPSIRDAIIALTSRREAFATSSGWETPVGVLLWGSPPEWPTQLHRLMLYGRACFGLLDYLAAYLEPSEMGGSDVGKPEICISNY